VRLDGSLQNITAARRGALFMPVIASKLRARDLLVFECGTDIDGYPQRP
jgi:hypothetical protein